MTTRILRLDAGANHAASVSRPLATALIEGLSAKFPVELTTVELSEGVPFVDARWIAGTRSKSPTAPEAEAAAVSDAFIAQLEWADVLVITAPVYNFSIPAALKAWIDQITRAGRTFRYTGPGQAEGLLRDKKAYVVIAAGGVKLGSPADFAAPYLRHLLGFIGITDLEVIDASGLALDPEATVAAARERVSELIELFELIELIELIDD
jgi:FMN-dependent NADH-azoreductase